MFVTLTVANPADILLPRQLNCNSMGKATIATTAAQLISFHRHLSLGNKVFSIISIIIMVTQGSGNANATPKRN